MAKRTSLVLGILFGFLSFFTDMTELEPHSVLVRDRVLVFGSLFLCVSLIWYGLRRAGN
jgi:hypothetical protein